jgi:hypothetical protein
VVFECGLDRIPIGPGVVLLIRLDHCPPDLSEEPSPQGCGAIALESRRPSVRVAVISWPSVDPPFAWKMFTTAS